MRFGGLILTVLSIYTPAALGRSWSKNKDAVLLSTVKALTLRDGAMTTHRRVDALPQLTCIGGNAKGLYTVDRMRCTNSGHEYDAEDIQWTCKADLPMEFKLGGTDVICEGYDSPEDPYVLKGSCAVEYRLILTKAGEEKYGLPKSSWFGGSERVKPGERGHRSESKYQDHVGLAHLMLTTSRRRHDRNVHILALFPWCSWRDHLERLDWRWPTEWRSTTTRASRRRRCRLRWF